jgi:Ubiquitin 3 binding protein But2 C-terminal domain
MKLILITPIALIAGASALVIHDGGCTFTLTAAGGVSGQLSQLGDGQNRVGASGLAVATYIIGAEGGIFDQDGRGCILMPSTTQFRCDAGAGPTIGFSIGCDGTLSYNGDSTFVACQTGDNGLNVYTTAGLGQTSCIDITLNADSCHAECAPPAPPPPPSSPPPTPKTCPADLSGTYEFPHLIVPISSSNPDRAYGTSYNGQVSRSDTRTIFNFDIPAVDAGKTCSLVFLFPRQDQLQTSAFTISGDGNVGFASLAGVVHQGTTYNSVPPVAQDYGIFSLSPGRSYSVATFDCPAGTTQSYSMTAAGTDFHYFQDYNPSP